MENLTCASWFICLYFEKKKKTSNEITNLTNKKKQKNRKKNEIEHGNGSVLRMWKEKDYHTSVHTHSYTYGTIVMTIKMKKRKKQKKNWRKKKTTTLTQHNTQSNAMRCDENDESIIKIYSKVQATYNYSQLLLFFPLFCFALFWPFFFLLLLLLLVLHIP